MTKYSPFVVELAGSTVSDFGYRFGYQGSEKDNEFKGEVNSYTTEFRQLDSFAMKYPPYQDFTKIIMEYLGYTLTKPYGQNNSDTSYFENQKTYDNVKNLSRSS